MNGLNKILDNFATAIEGGDMVLDVKEMETIPEIEKLIQSELVKELQAIKDFHKKVGTDMPWGMGTGRYINARITELSK